MSRRLPLEIRLLMIVDLMLLFISQCEGTKGGPLNNNTVPYPLRDWVPTNKPKSTSTPFSTSTSTSSPSVISSTGKDPEHTLLSADAITTASDSRVTRLNDPISSHIVSTPTTSPEAAFKSEPALSIAAIAGIAVGCTVLLALLIGSIVLVLRRRKPKEIKEPDTCTPEEYNKPELDGHMLTYHDTKSSGDAQMNASVVYAELDGGDHSVKELAGSPGKK